MKLILIRSPQLFFYKMKSKKKIKNMTTDTITITITISDGRKLPMKRSFMGKIFLVHHDPF